MTVRHLLVAAAPGDATTSSAFETRDVIARATGVAARVHARFVDEALRAEVGDLDALAQDHGSSTDVLVFHASIGDPIVYDVVAARPERLVVVYHNVSPAAPFRPWDPTFAALLSTGREQIASLGRRAVVAIAPSEFNAAELRAWGYSDVRVVPLVVDVEARLQAALPRADAEIVEVDGDPCVLFVGQLQPHKRPELLVEMAHVLATYAEPNAQVVIAGAHRLRGYVAAVKAFAEELRAPVTFTGSLTDAALAGLYRRADVFATASEHEGFCVPILEAMAFGVPVVARACGAIPEIAGDAAVLLDPDDGAAVFAEAVAEVARVTGPRDVLVDRGHERVRAFAPEVARQRLLDSLTEVL